MPILLILDEPNPQVSPDSILSCKVSHPLKFVGVEKDRLLVKCDPFGEPPVTSLLVRATYAEDSLPSAVSARKSIPVIAYWRAGKNWTERDALEAEQGSAPVDGALFGQLAIL
ncbi:MAG: hypothetical protein BGO01_00255 [Armatimonadetes bacterium 55-13]|nr:hypothetical protein [Armatimonadota bacterium]OJU63132.1 MAG: hypothetical protein BGO01_00255 [Armatimonadetes bacterium 55-13]